MYVTHYDHQNQRWNVFLKTERGEEYVTWFNDVRDAQAYCALKNTVITFPLES